MAAYQYVYHMDGPVEDLSRRQEVLSSNIRLSFLPGVKIGVVGVNGAGKSTLLRIMAGIDTDFSGEAWAATGRPRRLPAPGARARRKLSRCAAT